jgi:uncharacterized membrane protein
LVVVGGALVAEVVAPLVAALWAAAVLVSAPGEGVIEGLAQHRRLRIHGWQVVGEQDRHGLLKSAD